MTWLTAGAFQVPSAGLSGQIRGPEHKRPPTSELVRKLIADARHLASSNSLNFPTMECVLTVLLDKSTYGENDALRDSGIDPELLRHAMKERQKG
jgi:hypothetical protein